MTNRHHERHKIETVGWLRAAVLGANDGIVSTACLMLGVASAQASTEQIVITGAAGLVAGAMSMATGEYISVHSQSDTEKAALAEETIELAENYEGEIRELTGIYMRRGLDQALAREVAVKLMQSNALDAHARDELGINELSSAKPLQAAVSSATSFSVGAALPLLAAACFTGPYLIWGIVLTALAGLASLGGLAAKTGGAKPIPAMVRVTFWSALAMAITSGIGTLLGTVI
jgi:VIT1/CCC1 family predicted Fe2+/Mn2+ transporter